AFFVTGVTLPDIALSGTIDARGGTGTGTVSGGAGGHVGLATLDGSITLTNMTIRSDGGNGVTVGDGGDAAEIDLLVDTTTPATAARSCCAARRGAHRRARRRASRSAGR